MLDTPNKPFGGYVVGCTEAPKKIFIFQWIARGSGGGDGIRTHDTP
jgi:hypothetical protein